MPLTKTSPLNHQLGLPTSLRYNYQLLKLIDLIVLPLIVIIRVDLKFCSKCACPILARLLVMLQLPKRRNPQNAMFAYSIEVSQNAVA